jgi:hypothetical protein
MIRAWFPIVLVVLALDMMTPRAWGKKHPATAPTPTTAPTTQETSVHKPAANHSDVGRSARSPA